MTAPTRLAVHSSVAYPAALAPRSNTSFNFSCSVGDNHGGRPGVGRLRSPFFLSRRYACSQRTTELGAAPTVSATSRYDFPACSRVIARRRRASNCSAVPGGLIPPTIVKHAPDPCIISSDVNNGDVTLCYPRALRRALRAAERRPLGSARASPTRKPCNASGGGQTEA